MTTPRKTELQRAATAMGRKGGKASSPAKTRAVRQNITDAWIAKRLTAEERAVIRWALEGYLDSDQPSQSPNTEFDQNRRADAETALAKLQPRKEWDKAKGIQAPVESAESMDAQRAELLDVILSPKPLVKRKEPPHDD